MYESIVKNTSANDYRLILVDDASTDDRLIQFLNNLVKKDTEIILLRNEENLGFLPSANKAFNYVQSDIFILLNTDTQVPKNWLTRLIAPFYEDTTIASTTHFSNAGTLNSFPEINCDMDLIYGLPIDEIDSEFSTLPKLKERINIPSGVGFCMGMRTQLVRDYGFFDLIYGKGYCEENDWCLRLSSHGYKHVLVENLFIYHQHGGTFTPIQKRELIKKNFEILVSRYPNYEKHLYQYFQADPAAPFRKFTHLKLFAKYQSPDGAVLFIDHNMGGGANYYRKELTNQFLQKKIPILVLVEFRGKITIEVQTPNENFLITLPAIDSLQFIFEQILIKKVIYNNAVGANDPIGILKKILEIQKSNSFHLVSLVHDFFMICPSYRLLNNQGAYCGVPDQIQTCLSCLPKQSTRFNDFLRPSEDMKNWRNVWEQFLMASDEILAFSNGSKKILSKAYPLLKQKILVKPHITDVTKIQPIDSANFDSECHIGIVGGINYAKGLNVVHELSNIIRRQPNEKTKITIVGEVTHSSQLNEIDIMGRYSREYLSGIVKRRGINIFLFPSVWPETYAYVVDELIAMDLPVVCFNIGAPPERVVKYSKGLVVDLGISPSDLLNTLVMHYESFTKTNEVYYASNKS